MSTAYKSLKGFIETKGNKKGMSDIDLGNFIA